MKIASWNVNSLKVRLPHLLEWLVSAQPDVVALQETKTIDENFPQEEIEGAGYHVRKPTTALRFFLKSRRRMSLPSCPG